MESFVCIKYKVGNFEADEYLQRLIKKYMYSFEFNKHKLGNFESYLYIHRLI